MMNRYRKKKGMIKGEHKKIKQWRKKHHGSLQLKSEQRSKDITPSIRFWVISARE
jgi:tRNA G37 N-methylase TrmD